MASQEFLASFAVDIDESGVSRLQSVLEENRDLANEVASAFSAATAAIREYQDAASGNTGGSGEGNRDTGSPASNAGTKTGAGSTAEPDRTGWHYVEESDRWMPDPDTAMKNLAQLQLSGVLTGEDAPAVPTTAKELVLRNLETMYLGQASRDSANAAKKLVSWEDIGLSSNPAAREGYDDLIAAAQDLIREPMEQARVYMKQAIDAEEAGQDGSEYIQMVDEVLRRPLEQVRELVDSFDFGDEPSGSGKGGTDGESESELDLDTSAAEEALEAFREKAAEPISISLDASDSLGEGNDQSGKLDMDLTEARASLEAFRKDASEPVSIELDASGSLGEGNDQSGKLNMDLTEARANLEAFRKDASKPVSLSGNASGMVSAARAAYNSIKSLFSAPITIKASVEKEGAEDGEDPGVVKMSAGGRFSRPTDVQVAEDGDAEYIIPVKKENRAVPLLRQLLSELSPAARESLTLGDAAAPLSGGIAAGTASAPQITQNNSNVSAPVTIQVHASGANAEQVGRSVYDTAERYLLRTLKSVTAL